MEKAILALEDGHFFYGKAFSGLHLKEAGGEVIFNTSMTGYQEILTDPSYKGQIVVMTPSQVGNYGINEEDLESEKIHVNAFIVKDLSLIYSSWRGKKTLKEYLDSQNVIGLTDIDTRALVRVLREYGVMKGYIGIGDISPEEAVKRAKDIPDISQLSLVPQVSSKKVFQWTEGSWELGTGYKKIREFKYKVAVINYGVKRNILRLMADRGIHLTIFPHDTKSEDIIAFKPDGIFLSNGPGDPATLEFHIKQIKQLLKTDIPIFGICLGHQLLTWAVGSKTYKLEFGHHGGNHPVKNLITGKIEITAQNHNYATDDTKLPSNVKITHINLNDNTIEGIRLTDKPVFSIQYHPESSPGPHDSHYIFDDFVRLIEETKNNVYI